MAVSTTSYFSNSAQGLPGVAGDFNKFDSSTIPKFPIGHRIPAQNGDVYVYSHFGLTTKAGDMVSTDLSESSLVDSDNIVIAPASTVSTTDGAVGSKFVQITLAAVTADQYAGGKLIITDGPGIGYTYRIKGNTATDDPTTGDFRLELYDKIQVALDATSDIAISGSLYANLEPATTTDIAASGVSCAAQATADYGWIQTEGDVGVYGTAVIGSGVILSVTAGEVVTATVADILDRVGVVLVAGDANGLSVIKLTLG